MSHAGTEVQLRADHTDQANPANIAPNGDSDPPTYGIATTNGGNHHYGSIGIRTILDKLDAYQDRSVVSRYHLAIINLSDKKMQKLPHHYAATAAADRDENVDLSSEGLTSISSAPPAAFGGPGNLWSPETLLIAAVADCFVLTFKAIARASKFDWISLTCEAKGTLDRVDNVTRFTDITQHVVLDVPQGTDEQMAMRLLEKSEQACLITNSLKSGSRLEATVIIVSK